MKYYKKTKYSRNHKKYTKKNKKYTKKIKKPHTKKQKGGIVTPYAAMFTKDPIWQAGGVQWTTLVNIAGLPNLFGSSIPPENIFECIQTLAFYMYVKDIKRIISLQGCPQFVRGALPRNCLGQINLDPATDDDIYEENVWMGLKRMTNITNIDANIEFLNCQIPDMTSGSLVTWNTLNRLNLNDPNKKTLIHCYAGLGRTGSVLLFTMVKLYYAPGNVALPALQQQYLGFADSYTMYNTMMAGLTRDTRNNNDPENGTSNAIINRFNANEIAQEVFNIDDMFHTNLLIERINYIILYTALDAGLINQNIYLYEIKTNFGAVYTANNVFNTPIRVVIDLEIIRAAAFLFGLN